MKSLMRKLVAGPKKKTAYKGEELDLTYITKNIIAMAFPASNFLEKAYRNSIDDVAQYFKEHHPENYLVINVSSRPYDYTKFQNRVLEYEWPDHQAPPVTTLIDIAHKVYQFLAKHEKGVVAVHCNHGKGRTGTAIISILLFMGLHRTAKQALAFYNSQRFSEETYGVDQPCQTRYIGYIQKLLSLGSKIPKKLIAYRLSHVSHTGLHDKHYITIKHVRTAQLLVQRFNFCFHSKIQGLPLMGDLFIEVFEEGWASNKHIARINYHSFFIDPATELSVSSLSKESITVVFKGQNIKCSKSLDKNFTITLQFQYFCLCHLQNMEVECQCHFYRQSEEHFWRKMIKQCKESPYAAQLEGSSDKWKYEDIVQKQMDRHENDLRAEEEIYVLGKNMSNLNNQTEVIGVLRQAQQPKEEEELLEEEMGSERQEELDFQERRRHIPINIKNVQKVEKDYTEQAEKGK